MTPEEMFRMLLAAGVPGDALIIEPTVTMRAPGDDGWISVVPRIYAYGDSSWYVMRYSPRRKASWLSEHPDPVAAVDHIGAFFFTGHRPPPAPEREPSQPGREQDGSGGLPWDR